MDDPAKIWDDILASKLPTENTTATASAYQRCRLRLSRQPTAIHLKHRPRNPALIPEGLRKVIRSLVSGEAPWPLFVAGPAGVGKTCAGLCLLDYAGGWYRTVEEFCEDLRIAELRGLDWRTPEARGTYWPADLWRQVEQARLVVLDELGAREKVSDHHYAAVKRLVDLREGKPLVCLSNLGLGDLARLYDDRLTSRLSAGTVVILEGPDRRLRKDSP